MNFLGIDFGIRKVGLAKAASGTPAVPLKVLTYRDRAELISQIFATCQEEGITEIVVGLPVSMAGNQAEEKPVAAKARQFAQALQNTVKAPVHLYDERLSTREASRLRQGLHGGPEDAVAAMLILQSYLDRRQHFDRS